MLAVLVAALAGALLLSTPAVAALLNPTSPVAAPAVVEAFSPYLGQVSCDPTAKPGAIALRDMLLKTYGGRDLGISRECSRGGRSEHKEGRGWDWGLEASVPAEKAAADQFLTWLTEPGKDGVPAYNARRLGVMYAIYNRRGWSAYKASDGWQAYSGPSPHTDHIHISLSWNGAMKQTSFWTGRMAAVDYGPCRRYVGLPAEAYTAPRTDPTCPAAIAVLDLTESPALAQGAKGPYVAQLQHWLGITVDGSFGPMTARSLSAFQAAKGLPVTARTDGPTWLALRAPRAVASSKPTTTAKPTASPKPSAGPKPTASPKPAAKPKTTTTRKPTATPKPTAAAKPSPAVKASAPPAPWAPRVSGTVLSRFAGLTLRKGASGPAVVALQRALKITPDGAFGPKTAAAVRAFNMSRKLPAEPVVRRATWAALGHPKLPLPSRGR